MYYHISWTVQFQLPLCYSLDEKNWLTCCWWGSNRSLKLTVFADCRLHRCTLYVVWILEDFLYFLSNVFDVALLLLHYVTWTWDRCKVRCKFIAANVSLITPLFPRTFFVSSSRSSSYLQAELYWSCAIWQHQCENGTFMFCSIAVASTDANVTY